MTTQYCRCKFYQVITDVSLCSQGNPICDTVPSGEEQVISIAEGEVYAQAGTSSTSSQDIVLLPVSLSTRSKRRWQPEAGSRKTEGCEQETRCEQNEATAFAVPSLIECHEPKDMELFERPLTRARKRHMAHAGESKPTQLKRRKNL